MKKLFFAGLISVFLAVMPMSVYGATREKHLDSADIAFLSFMNTDCDISYTRRPLFNEKLEQSGWQYNFHVDSTYGFALITDINENDAQMYEVEEVYYEQHSPYDKCTGLPIYITFRQYIQYEDNCFIDLSSGNTLSEELIIKIANMGFGYSGSGDTTEISETISYASKTESTYSIQGDLPKYSGIEGATNCANVAGGIVIGYYDRFCENLIPDFKNYRELGTAIVYKLMTPESGAVITTLKDLMGTDKNQLGTTFTGFQSGMMEYVSSHGYTYSSESVLSAGIFNFAKYKDSVENSKPVALFLNNYSLVNLIQENDCEDIIISEHSTVAHVVIACGYKKHNYYNSNGQIIAERIYLKISSGFALRGICYLNINSVSTIDKAISINIS
ncbi:MAG: hypothetical protein NC131_05885 [Roseburia sp.]|nr:hypothetical protein [Roseburia sp.]